MSAPISVETLILSHANTDFDAFASMLAAQLLYPGARICLHGGVNRNVREFYNLHADQIPSVEQSLVDRESVGRVILVEVSDADRLGDLGELVRRDDVEVVVFDHHGGPQIEGASVLVGRDGSLVTAMLPLLLERGIKIGPMHATAFALGIHEDTGSLTFSSTTDRDIDALAACLRAGANQELLARYLRAPLRDEQHELLRRLGDARRELGVAGMCVVASSAQADRYVEDVSTLVSRVGDVTDWDALVLCVLMEERVLVVARSRNRALAVDRALEALGGGGHPQAASAIVREVDPAAVLERVLGELRRVAEPAPCAQEVMSRPVRAVAGSDGIAKALIECQRFGLSGIQISENGDLTGTVSREDLDRAVQHGLGHAPVKGVMSSGVPVIGSRATIGELRELLATGATGRLIVVANGPYRTEERIPIDQAVGVITGGDVLRALHEPANVERPVLNERATSAVRARLGQIERLREVLPAIETAAAPYEGVYLVGGAVRDVLLREQSLDLDLMVEGDALAFARALASELGVHYHPHEKFQTAVVKGRDSRGRDLRLDVASARTEFYDSPGALPEVERSTLRHDLARRDFTINAMAASLKADDLGTTYDFFGGFDDLERKTVRVLHNLSFVEDPTRLLRAVRYEVRFGFRMDNHTLSLARGCIEMRLVGNLASARLRDELLDLVVERRFERALERAAELGLDRALYPRLSAGAQTIALIRRIDAVAKGEPFGGHVRTPLLRIAALCRQMRSDEIYEWLDSLRFPRRDQDIVAASATLAPRLAERLAALCRSPSEAHELLKDQPLEVLVTMAALSDSVAERIQAYVERVRGVRLEITGDDLKAAGARESPELGRALREALALKLDGLVSGREEELRAALGVLDIDEPE